MRKAKPYKPDNILLTDRLINNAFKALRDSNLKAELKRNETAESEAVGRKELSNAR